MQSILIMLKEMTAYNNELIKIIKEHSREIEQLKVRLTFLEHESMDDGK